MCPALLPRRTSRKATRARVRPFPRRKRGHLHDSFAGMRGPPGGDQPPSGAPTSTPFVVRSPQPPTLGSRGGLENKPFVHHSPLRPRFSPKLTVLKRSRRDLFKSALLDLIRAECETLCPGRGQFFLETFRHFQKVLTISSVLTFRENLKIFANFRKNSKFENFIKIFEKIRKF